MDALTGKQKRFLRSRGQSLAPLVSVGKAGLTQAVLAALSDQLDRHELVKIKLPAGPERKVLAAKAAETLTATRVGVIGRTALLYRANNRLDDDKRIPLP